MTNRTKTILPRHFQPVLVIVGLVWLVFVASLILPLNKYGIVPRTQDGLIGILSMPVLHANLNHLLANTVPLLVLLALMVLSRPDPWRTAFALTVISGVVIWLLARPMIHIGASGLIYALMGYLIVIGLRERRLLSLLVATAVGIAYGSVIVSGILPGVPGVSWESHLIGLLAGAVYAWITGKQSATRSCATPPASRN